MAKIKTIDKKTKMENQINYKRALNFFIISSIFLILIISLAEAERLPTVNSDSNNWGTVLNNFLLLEHNQNGTHKNVTINGTLGINTTTPAQTLTVQGTLNVTPAGQGSTPSIFVASSGNVGIGTTGPASTLHINSSSVQGALLVTNGSGSNYTAFFVNASSGNVGIGTTNPANRLYVVLDDGVASGEHAIVSILRGESGFNPNQAVFIGYRADGTNPTGGFIRASDSRSLFLGTSSFPEALTILNGGNVGINTTTPAQTLTVQGTLNVTGNSTGTGDLFVSSSGNVGIGTASPGGKLNVVGTAHPLLNLTAVAGLVTPGMILMDQIGTAHNFLIQSTGYNDATGNGIMVFRTARGSQASPTASGLDDFSYQIRGYGYDGSDFQISSIITSYIDGTWSSTSRPTRLAFATTANGSTTNAIRMTIKNDGNVGINTTVPSERLVVMGNASFNSSDAGTSTMFVDATNQKVGIGTTAPYNTLTVVGSVGVSGSLNASSINTTGSAYFATASGNVGINTTNPSATLKINGTLNVTSQNRPNTDFGVMPDGGIVMDNLLSASASTDVNIDSNNELHKVTSSKRFKEDIKNIELDTGLIYDLLPRTFVWNNESGSYGKTDFGLVAEEVNEIIPDLVSYDSSGEPYSVKYQMLTVLLLKEMQDIKKEIDKIKQGSNILGVENVNGSIIVRLG